MKSSWTHTLLCRKKTCFVHYCIRNERVVNKERLTFCQLLYGLKLMLCPKRTVWSFSAEAKISFCEAMSEKIGFYYLNAQKVHISHEMQIMEIKNK